MASENKGTLLGAFFDEGACTPLYGSEGGAVSAAYGMVGGQPAYAVSQNGGTLRAADVDLCVKTAELAAKTGNPVVTFYNASGLSLEDGLQSLASVKALNEASARISGVVPQIAIVTGVCGASQALAAANADVCIMAEDAELFLTAPFIAAANDDKTEGAGSAAAAVQAGVAAIVAKDAEAAAREAAKLVTLLPGNNLSAPAQFEYEAPSSVLAPAKYTAEAAIASIADPGSTVELYKGFGGSVTTVLATVAGSVTGLVVTNGADTTLGTHCVTRIARFVRLCDTYSIPVVTVLNTGGFAPSAASDIAGTIRGAARVAGSYADATTAKVCVVAGKAVGAVYSAMGDADLTIAMQGCVLSAAEPAAAVTVLYKDELAAAEGGLEAATAARAKQYEQDEASAAAAVKAGLADFAVAPAALRASVANALDILASKRVTRIAKKHGNTAL